MFLMLAKTGREVWNLFLMCFYLNFLELSLVCCGVTDSLWFLMNCGD